MLKKYLKSDFSRNVLTLITGTIIAQALPIAISPILTRIYTPSDFGVLALFVAFASVFGTIANARYELAIIIPKSEKEALSIFILGIIIAFFLSLILLIIVLLFHNEIVTLLDNEEISIWLYFIPLSVFAIGIFNALNYYNTRLKKFKNIAQSNVIKSTTLSLLNLGIGAIKTGALGLIIGQFISYFSGNIKLSVPIFKNKDILREINIQDIKSVAFRYRNFPKYTMPSSLANVLSQNLTAFITSILFSVKTLGFYSFSLKIIGTPSALIGQSFGQVYIDEASRQRKEIGNAIQVFDSTLKKLILISLPIFGLIFFVAEDAFAIIFGEEWRIAGVYAKILIPLFCMKFILAPISVTNSVFEKQHISLLWQLGLLIITLLIFLIAYLYNQDFKSFLYFYSGTLSIYYIFFIFILRKVSKASL